MSVKSGEFSGISQYLRPCPQSSRQKQAAEPELAHCQQVRPSVYSSIVIGIEENRGWKNHLNKHILFIVT